LFAVNEGFLDDVDTKKIVSFKKEWFEYLEANLSDLEGRLNAGSALSDEDKKVLKDSLTTFKSNYFS